MDHCLNHQEGVMNIEPKEYKVPFEERFGSDEMNLNENPDHHGLVRSGEHSMFQCPTCHVLLSNPAQFLNHTAKHKESRVINSYLESEDPTRSCHVLLKRLEEELREAVTKIGSPVCLLPRYGVHPEEERCGTYMTSENENENVCNICCRKLSSKDNLLRHMKRHTGEKPFACGFCNYKAIQKHHLQNHIRKSHGEEQLLASQVLSRKCSNITKKVNLKYPYGCHKCQRCGVGFRHKRNLGRHLTTFHSIVEKSNKERRRVKESTSSDFDFNSIPKDEDVPSHWDNVTSQEKCKPALISDEIVKRLQFWKLAVGRNRVSPLPVSCRECGRIMSNRDTLNRHMLIHRGIKPYPCLECGERFRQKHHVEQHKRRHHHHLKHENQGFNPNTQLEGLTKLPCETPRVKKSDDLLILGF